MTLSAIDFSDLKPRRAEPGSTSAARVNIGSLESDVDCVEGNKCNFNRCSRERERERERGQTLGTSGPKVRTIVLAGKWIKISIPWPIDEGDGGRFIGSALYRGQWTRGRLAASQRNITLYVYRC